MKWEVKTLGEVVTKGSSNVSVNKIKEIEGEYPIYGAKGLIKNVDFYHQDKEYISIIKDGAGIGRVEIRKPFSSVIGTLQYIIPKENIDTKFLYYFLLSIDFSKYSQGAAIPHIYFKDYKDERIPLPPLDTQKEIVKFLDSSFEKIEKLKEDAQKNLENAKEIFESELNSIFEHPKEHWEEKELGEVTIKSKNIDWNKNKYNFFQYIDLTAVCRENFSITNSVEINFESAPSRAKKIINFNDIIFATTRPTLKRVSKIPKCFDNQICSTGFVVLKPNDKMIISDYIFYFLQTKLFIDNMEVLQRGASYPAVSDNDIKSQKISFPPSFDEQQEIVEKLNTLQEKTKQLEEIYEKKLQNIEELKQSILQKAFEEE